MTKIKVNGRIWYYKEVEVDEDEDEKTMLELYNEKEEYVSTLPNLDYLKMVVEMSEEDREQWLAEVY